MNLLTRGLGTISALVRGLGGVFTPTPPIRPIVLTGTISVRPVASASISVRAASSASITVRPTMTATISVAED